MKLTVFPSLYQAKGAVLDVGFEEFYRQQLAIHQQLSDKKSGRLFSLADFGPTATRHNCNVAAVSGAVLDFDGGQECYSDLLQDLDDLEHVAYSTFSHSAAAPKFRLVIPFQQAIAPHQWAAAFDMLLTRLGWPKSLDISCSEIGRAYYLPAKPIGSREPHFSTYQPGVLFQPDLPSDFAAQPPISAQNGKISAARSPTAAGRNNALKAQASACLEGKKDLLTTVRELLDYDARCHQPPLFSDSRETGYIPGSPELTAIRFVTNIWASHARNKQDVGVVFPSLADPMIAAASSPLTTIDVADFLNLEIPRKSDLLTPWLHEQSINMVFAFRGIGKTHFTLGVGLAVASGTSFLRWQAPAPARVLYLDGEMASWQLQERLRKKLVGESLPARGFLTFLTPDLLNCPIPDLSTPTGQAQIAEVVAATDPQLIIVDNISCLLPGNGRENESESWLGGQRWSLDMKRQGRSVLFVHHSGKDSKAQRGTSRREDLMDSVICLSRPEGHEADEGCSFSVSFEKSRAVYGPGVASFEASLVDDENGRQSWQIQQDLRADVLKLHEAGYSQREIAAQVGRDKSFVRRHLKKANKLAEPASALSKILNSKTASAYREEEDEELI